MTKATTKRSQSTSDNAIFFKDPTDNSIIPVTKIETKEADGKRHGAHQTPASLDNLRKLQEKFAK